MTIRWTEQQYNEHLRQRMQQTEPKKKRTDKRKPVTTAPRPKSDALLCIELPWLTPLTNGWSRMHFTRRKTEMERIGAAVARAIPVSMLRQLPLKMAHVRITRLSAVAPDPGGLQSLEKPILDALQQASKRHPYGAGVIVEDSADRLSYEVKHEIAAPKRGRTIIEVWEGKR